MIHDDPHATERIREAFTAPAMPDEVKKRIRATVRANRYQGAAQQPTRAIWLSAAALTALAGALVLSYVGPFGSAAPAMAAMAEGLRKLDRPGVVHYRVASVGVLTEQGEVLRRTRRTEEFWIDSERHLARTETQGLSGEAVKGAYVTVDDTTYSTQTDELNGRRETHATTQPAGRDWSDDFDGTIQSLIDWIDDGTAQIVGTTTIQGQDAVIARVTTDPAGKGDKTTETQTFWLRRSDYVPLKIEYGQRQMRDGELRSEYREVRTFSEYELLAPDSVPARLFEVPR